MIVLSVTQNTNCDSGRHIIVLSVILLKVNFYCQAQPQLQVKLSLKAELALFSIIRYDTRVDNFECAQ